MTKTSLPPDRADKAKAFVEDRLKGIEFVVIKTYKMDMCGRYVADVFYHPTINTTPSYIQRSGVVPTFKNRRVRDKKKEEVFEKGFFINMELLAEGLADPF